MRNAGVCFGQTLQFGIVKVDAVGEPDVRADPAEAFHVFQRAHIAAGEGEVLLVLCFAQMGVQADMILPRKQRALPEKLG